MAGNVTHGFDMALEISELTIQNWIWGLLDSNINQILGTVAGFPNGSQVSVNTTVSFDQQIGFNDNVFISVILDFPFQASGLGLIEINATLSFSLPLIVDRTELDKDKIAFDFSNVNNLQFEINSPPSPLLNPIETSIENAISGTFASWEKTTLLPIPVDRTTSNSRVIKQADTKIIDDTSSIDNDALAILLTFGGGVMGNLNAFTSAFSNPGVGGSLAINIAWICRNASPLIESGIGLPVSSFSNCGYSGNHDLGNGVHLTNLNLTAGNDYIRLSGRVTKSGFCYDAEATFGAKIYVGMVNNTIKFGPVEIENPDIDIDIPWWCYLLAAILGALLGAIFGVIAAIVGAIVLPLLLWLANDVIEGLIGNFAEDITNDINSVLNNVALDIEIPGLSNYINRVFFDDLTLEYGMNINEYWPIKSEGEIVLHNGEYFDLDSGMVKNSAFADADLQLIGEEQNRKLKVLCGSQAADLFSERTFEFIRRFDLHACNYGQYREIPLNLLANRMPVTITVNGPFGITYTHQTGAYEFVETFRLFAAKTSDNSIGFFQITEVTHDTFKIKYKVYKNNKASVSIKGNFKCPRRLIVHDLERDMLTYISSKSLNEKTFIGLEQKFADQEKFLINRKVKEMAIRDISKLDRGAIRANLYQEEVIDVAVSQFRPVGNHYITIRERSPKTALLYPKVYGNVQVDKILWKINSLVMDEGDTGTFNHNGVSFDYKVENSTLNLTSSTDKETDVPIRLEVMFIDGSVEKSIRCIHYKNECRWIERKISLFKDYQTLYSKEYGMVEI